MASLDTERAPQVCRTCKIRKKGCDKQLPSCGYCTKRGLICRYENLAVKQSDLVALAGNQHMTRGTSPGSVAFLLPARPLSDPSRLSGSRALSDIIHVQVCRVIQSTNLSLHAISERFFRGFHRWLPVISPTLFHETAAQSQLSPPPADFSVLLLAMCLITLRPPASTSEQQTHPEVLYVTVRMLFVHVQAVICASTSLVQAGLLISAYEYGCGRPDAAHISMGSCARMAHTIGIDKYAKESDELQHDTESRRRALEQWNVWWGVVILERIILFEIDGRSQRPATEYPSQDSHLPSDLEPAQQLQSRLSTAEPLDTPTLSAIHASNVSRFGRQAQAVQLLDQVLHVISLAGGDIRLPELRRLDGHLQAFLSLVMGESGWVEGIHCGAIAIAIRSLVLLHHNILTQTATSAMDEAVGAQRESSSAALDTAARMMAVVAHDHMETNTNVDALPLCCAYNLRVAMKHIEHRRGHIGSKDLSLELESLLALEMAFYKRWSSAGA